MNSPDWYILLHTVADRIQQESDEACASEPRQHYDGNSITKINHALLERPQRYPFSI